MYPQTGILSKIVPGAQIKRYHVLGERCSGTNYAKRLLGRNTHLEPTEALGWKHGFPHARAIPADLAVIGVVRSADAWIRSMHAKPWHTHADMQRLGFSDFIRAPWDTYVDRPDYFKGAESAGILGQVLQLDRHPLSGKRFENLFALRQAKLTGLLSYLDRDCTFILLRMEDMISDPESCVRHIAQALGCAPCPDGYRQIYKKLGAKFSPQIADRPETPPYLSKEDHAFLKASVNTAQEAALGYFY